MGGSKKPNRTPAWTGAVAVTNKDKKQDATAAKASQQSTTSSRKAAQVVPCTPGPSSGAKGTAQKGSKGKEVVRDHGDDDEEDIAMPPPRRTNHKRKVVDEEDDEDEDDFPSSDTVRSDDAPPPKKSRRTAAEPAPELDEPVSEREAMSFLILQSENLNIDDKDAVRKGAGVYEFYDRCLNAYRMCGAYVNLEEAYRRGAELSALDDYLPMVGGDTLHEDVYFYDCHCILNEWVPELCDAEKQFHKCPDAAVKILQYLDSAAARGRSNDMGRLRDRILDFAGIKTTDEVRHLLQRGNRGFNNPTLARLLVPMNKLKEFDADPDSFCRKVLENEDGYRFKASRWPAFLYDEKTHIPGKMRTGLLKNKVLLSAFLLIFGGPTAVNDELAEAAQSQGTPPLYQHYQLKGVTIQQIIYVACLVRSLLSAQTRWKARDGAWVGKDFVLSLLYVFYRNERWMEEMIDWWDRKVYGNKFEDDEDDEDCEAAMLLAEEAEEVRTNRRAQAAAQQAEEEEAKEQRDARRRAKAAAQQLEAEEEQPEDDGNGRVEADTPK